MLLTDVIVLLRRMLMEKFAFILGSSKQGKARRASGASNWEMAKYLGKEFQVFYYSCKIGFGVYEFT